MYKNGETSIEMIKEVCREKDLLEECRQVDIEF